MFPYIPFHIARYEKEIFGKMDILHIVRDMKYFRDEMVRLHNSGELSDDEWLDLMEFVNTIITHITDEERLVSIMGGVVTETASERYFCGEERREEPRSDGLRLPI